MASEEDKPGVRLAGDGASVTLLRLGAPSVGFPARCDLSVGSLNVSLDCELMGLDSFVEEVSVLHRSLSGAVSLHALDENFHLTLTSGSLGHVGVKVQLSKYASADFDLSVGFDLDQSYLPHLARGIRAEFLGGLS